EAQGEGFGRGDDQTFVVFVDRGDVVFGKASAGRVLGESSVPVTRQPPNGSYPDAAVLTLKKTIAIGAGQSVFGGERRHRAIADACEAPARAEDEYASVARLDDIGRGVGGQILFAGDGC